MAEVKAGELILAADIGGTKTHLGLFARGRVRPRLKVLETYASRAARDLETLVTRFLAQHPATPARACLAIAGPVMDGRCRATNLPWEVSEACLERRFGWPACLLNDLAATGLAIPLLTRREWQPINAAKSRQGHTLALLAPGTGLGTSVLARSGQGLIPVASEGGHVDFAPADDAQLGLWRYLSRRFGHVSLERVLSGPGLVNLFEWLQTDHGYAVPPWLAEDMAVRDPARAISAAALARRDDLCVEVMGVFVDILGAAAGNLALAVLATGGVYLGGGIPPKILPALSDGRFMEAFTAKGRFRPLLEKIPVRVILNPQAALLGAARRALDGGPP